MPISLDMSQEENIQLSLQAIEKEITLDLRFKAHNSVLVALALAPTITLGIIVSNKYLATSKFLFEAREDKGGAPPDDRRQNNGPNKMSRPDQGTIPSIRFSLLHFQALCQKVFLLQVGYTEVANSNRLYKFPFKPHFHTRWGLSVLLVHTCH